MRLLPDAHYKQWLVFAARICFAYNVAMHESIGGISPFQVQHGAPARDSMTSYLNLEDQPVMSEEDVLKLPAQFADAVKISTQAFFQLATTNDKYVREKTAEILNAL